MASLADLPELVGFFSYSREDDADSHGALSALRTRIQGELRGQLGRTAKTFWLWQDKEAIPSGTLWESEITTAVAQSVFFIPIITPTVIASPHCKFELESFLAREAALGRDNLVFPILYIDVPALDDPARRQNDPILSLIAKRQYVDWREVRYLDVNSTEVKRAIAQFCAHIRDAIHRISREERRKADAETALRQADAKRQQEEAEAKQRDAQVHWHAEQLKAREQIPDQPRSAAQGGSNIANAVRGHWKMFLAEGIGLTMFGLAAIMAASAFWEDREPVTVWVGCLLLVTGIVGLITIFYIRRPGVWSVLSAIVSIAAGIVLLLFWRNFLLPSVLIAFFVIEGITSIMSAREYRRQLSGHWGWILASGLVDLILACIGVIMFANRYAFYEVGALGLLVGINLMFGGTVIIIMAMAGIMTMGESGCAIDRASAVARAIRGRWKMFLAEGIVLTMLGLAAIMAASAFWEDREPVTVWVGCLLLVTGIVGLITIFYIRRPGFSWSFLSAIVSIATGTLLLLFWRDFLLPSVLIAFFVIEGITSIMSAREYRRQLSGHWGWILASGLVDLILACIGVIMFANRYAFYEVGALGLLVGINLMFGGAVIIIMAMTAKVPEAGLRQLSVL